MPEDEKITELITKLKKEHISKITGKEQTEYKFWSTQPVPKLDEAITENSAIEPNVPAEQVRKEPYPLPASFCWSDLDLKNKQEMDEVYTLLYENYVEDPDQTFRFDYAREILQWAMVPPGYRKEWHLGVRVSANNKLVGFICATPCNFRIYDADKPGVEINFLCVHKKLRSKRLAPVLIKEITRRSNINGIFQAVYTAGAYLPKPITTAEYFHRSLNPKNLIESGFSSLKKNMTMARTIKLYKLPDEPKIVGFRAARKEDIEGMYSIHTEYMKQCDFHQRFTKDEFEHYMTPIDDHLWTFVVEDPESHKITAFCSFYTIKNTVLNNPKISTIKSAFLWYYAAQSDDQLREVIQDAMISAKKVGVDVFNCMKIFKNETFVDDLKFAIGDGSLNFYLYNWKCPQVANNKQGFIVI